MRVGELKKELDGLFARFKSEMGELSAQVDARFAQVDARFADLEQRIAAEGEATRRYVDVVAEKNRAEVRLLYDKQAVVDETMTSNTQDHDMFKRALDDHEVRLKELERPRR